MCNPYYGMFRRIKTSYMLNVGGQEMFSLNERYYYRHSHNIGENFHDIFISPYDTRVSYQMEI